MTTRTWTTAAWSAVIAGILCVSVALTRRGVDASVPPRIARFSGSAVIAKMPSVLESPHLGERIDVDVIRDPESANFYDTPGVLDSIIDRWRRTLVAIGANVRIVDPARMGGRNARVIVIPSSPCLTIASREAIERAANDGRGVIVTGLTGDRDIGCRSIGFGFIVGTTGSSRADLVDDRASLYVTFPARSPLANGIPPGARLEVRPGQDVALRTSTRDGFYSNYSLQPEPAHDEPLLDGAVTHASLGRGRLVYWGFELRDVAASKWNEQIARLLVRNSVEWTAGAPSVTIEPWPRGKRAAAAIAQDVEDQFANARLAMDSLRAANVQGSYFLVSRLAKANERLTRDLAAAGEIGSHTENHWVLGGNPSDVQARRLEQSLTDLHGIVSEPIPGLRPPEEQFDEATLADWAKAGGAYVFGVNDQRSASPELLAVGTDTMVVVDRIGSDDFAAAAASHGSPSRAADIFRREYDAVKALGGAYVLSYHSQLFARPEWISALMQATRTIAADTSVWCVTTGQIASWWQARAQTTVRLTQNDTGVRIVVRNGGSTPLRGAVVHIRDLETKYPLDEDGLSLLPSDPGELRLLVPALAAHEERAFTARYEKPQPTASRTRVTLRRHILRRRVVRAQHWSWRRLFPWLH